MAEFVPDVAENSGEALRVFNDLRAALREVGVQAREAGRRELLAEFTPSSAYDPVHVRCFFPEAGGTVAVEGLLLTIGEEPTDDLRIALNFLNQELGAFAFYAAPGDDGAADVVVRVDLLPNLDGGATVHPREVKQALTGLCAQKAIFAAPLERVQGGRSWRFVKDALKAVK